MNEGQVCVTLQLLEAGDCSYTMCIDAYIHQHVDIDTYTVGIV
jgi:hypothetical protein